MAAGVWTAAGPLVTAGRFEPTLVAPGLMAAGLALAASGVGLIFRAKGQTIGSVLLGLTVLAIATATPLLTHHSLAGTWPGAIGSRLVARGWMAPSTIQALLICAVALLLPIRAGGPALRRLLQIFTGTLLAGTALLRLAAVLAGPDLGWEPLPGMPPALACGLLLVGFGVSTLREDAARGFTAADVWPHLPVATGVVLAALSCVAWHALALERNRPVADLGARDRTALADAIRRAVERHTHALEGLARMASRETDEAWARAARVQLAASPALVSIAWTGSGSAMRAQITADPATPQVIDPAMLRTLRRSTRAARPVDAPLVSGPVTLETAGDGFLIVTPVKDREGRSGSLVAAVRYHELLAGIPEVARVGVELLDDDRLIFRAGPPRPRPGQLSWQRVVLPGAVWRLRAWTGGTPLVPGGSKLPEIVFGLGLALSIVAGVVAYLLIEGGRRATSVHRANAELRQEIERRRQVESQLAAARDAALEAANAKSAFLATVSHEIRTPMNGVIGTVSLLLETPLQEEQREYAEQIRRSADSLVLIINDILDFSKIEAGKLTLESVDFELRTTLLDAIDVVAASAQTKGLELVCDVQPEVPAWVRGDPSRLRQMLLNLLGNAVKFTERGSVRLSVALEGGTPEAPMLRVTVTDTGIGIKREALTRLFAPFSQADGSMTRRYGGTGLGLAITRQLAELMGGRVGVDSIEGRGSAFWFTAQFAAAEPREAAGPLSLPLAGLSVLVADDHPVSLQVLADDLTGLGASVRTTASSEELFRAAAAPAPPTHIALIDESMPVRGGVMALDAARRLAGLPRLPAVLLTVRGRAEGVLQAQRNGFATCLVKPVRRHQLAETILAVMGNPTASPAVAPAPPARPVTRSLRVLVAEDNEVNQKVVVRMLERLGHHPAVAANGREAVEAVSRGGFDLVLMDCQMPEMDGFEATARIRAMTAGRRHLPVIALTANVSESDRQRCLAAGMDSHLAKPLKLERLAETIASFTEGAERRTA